MSKYNLSSFHAMYLANLHRRKEMTMTELTDEIGVDKANTTRVVRDLLVKGYLEKVDENERKFRLRLSKDGNIIARNLCVKIKLFTDKMFEKFTDEDKSIFFDLLNKLIEGASNA